MLGMGGVSAEFDGKIGTVHSISCSENNGNEPTLFHKMSRIARAVVPGLPHHVTQRGNGRSAVFDSEADRIIYLNLLRRNSAEYRLKVWAWCLMSNHIHLLAVPERGDSLHRALGRTHADYARYLNVKRASCGHLWQARFFSCIVAPELLWVTMAYIERNPVRAGLAVTAEQYRWSSAASHITGTDADHLIDMQRWRMEYTPRRWRQVLRTTVDAEAEAERIREATIRGRPLGEAGFVSDIESVLARTLRPKAVGRPRKSALVERDEQVAAA